MMRCKEAIDLLNEMSSSISTMFKELDPLLEEMGFVCFKPLLNTVIRDGAYRNLNEPQTWIPTYFSRAYKKAFGETEPNDAVYFVKIKLDEEEPFINVGGSISMDRSETQPFKYTDANSFFLDMRNRPLEEAGGIDLKELGDFHFYRLGNRLIICTEIPLTKIRIPDDLISVARSFPELRQALKSADKQLKAAI